MLSEFTNVWVEPDQQAIAFGVIGIQQPGVVGSLRQEMDEPIYAGTLYLTNEEACRLRDELTLVLAAQPVARQV